MTAVPAEKPPFGWHHTAQSAAGSLRLPEPAIRSQGQLFGAALTTGFLSGGLAVIENIPAAVQFCQATVDISIRHLGPGVPLPANVRAADKHTLIVVRPQRLIRQRVAQLVALLGGVDHHILAVYLPGAAGLVETVIFKAGSGRDVSAGQDVHRPTPNGLHVGFQLKAHAPRRAFPAAQPLRKRPFHAETGEQVDLFALHQNARVEHLVLVVGRAVRQADLANEGEWPLRLLADAHPAGALFQRVEVEVISAIRPLHHVGSRQRVLFRKVRNIAPPQADAVATPVAQIGQRRAPDYIISRTEAFFAACEVVAAINIEPVAEYARLAVRDVLPQWEVWVSCWVGHARLPFTFLPRIP